MYKVVLSHHAKERLAERIGTDKGVRHEITLRLIASLRLGAIPEPDLGVRVYLRDGYQAICYPTYEGTWVVATVLRPEMEIMAGGAVSAGADAAEGLAEGLEMGADHSPNSPNNINIMEGEMI